MGHSTDLEDMTLILLFTVVLLLCLVSTCTDDGPCEDEPERRACRRALADA